MPAVFKVKGKDCKGLGQRTAVEAMGAKNGLDEKISIMEMNNKKSLEDLARFVTNGQNSMDDMAMSGAQLLMEVEASRDGRGLSLLAKRSGRYHFERRVPITGTSVAAAGTRGKSK